MESKKGYSLVLCHRMWALNPAEVQSDHAHNGKETLDTNFSGLFTLQTKCDSVGLWVMALNIWPLTMTWKIYIRNHLDRCFSLLGTWKCVVPLWVKLYPEVPDCKWWFAHILVNSSLLSSPLFSSPRFDSPGLHSPFPFLLFISHILSMSLLSSSFTSPLGVGGWVAASRGLKFS